MAIEAGLLAAIGAKKGLLVNATELSEITTYDALLIGMAFVREKRIFAALLLIALVNTARIMRLVTFVGIVDEVGENTYAANRATYLINTPGMTGAEKHQYCWLPINGLSAASG
jgi:hypothetical protein